jgi:HD superfamily phosphohydrolase
VLVQKSLKENLVQEANEMRKKYAATLEMYDDELRDYRAVYENASKSYKDLKTQQIELKKLEIEKMDLDTKIENLEKIQEQFKDIQERIFQQTIVRFAEILLFVSQEGEDVFGSAGEEEGGAAAAEATSSVVRSR